jgi:16S rRNA (guanine966-N2)-methyltransferase
MSRYSSVRIIGGKWRSRRIQFPEILGLRPTQDRIRETLFNWLAPFMAGAHCLDLFAGSGVLGFEALSRGAEFCCFVDHHSAVIRTLLSTAGLLGISSNEYSVIQAKAPQKLISLEGAPFNIVFLDPPFGKDLLQKSIYWLAQSSTLQTPSLIYVEMEKTLQLSLPKNWTLYRQQSTSTLTYSLFSTL